VTNITDADELKSVLKEHIDAVMGRYGNDMYAIDVINERKSMSNAASSSHRSALRQRNIPR